MITDDERREVAQALRLLAEKSIIGVSAEAVDYALGLEIDDRYDVCGLFYREQSISRLADLIEPSCDRDALLRLADDMSRLADADYEPYDWGDQAAYWAQGIRDALRGEKDPRCDRKRLLAMAKVLRDMGARYNEHGRYDLGTTFKKIAENIREALGEEAA